VLVRVVCVCVCVCSSGAIRRMHDAEQVRAQLRHVCVGRGGVICVYVCVRA